MKFFTTVLLAGLVWLGSAIRIEGHGQALPAPTPADPNAVNVVKPADNPTVKPTIIPAQPVPAPAPQPTVVQPTVVQPVPQTKPAETKPPTPTPTPAPADSQAPQKSPSTWTDADEKEFSDWQKNLIPVTNPALQDKIKELVKQEKQRRKAAKGK